MDKKLTPAEYLSKRYSARKREEIISDLAI